MMNIPIDRNAPTALKNSVEETEWFSFKDLNSVFDTNIYMIVI